MRYGATALVIFAAACGARPETFVGAHAAVDAGPGPCDVLDSGVPSFPCDTNEDCLAAFAALAPNGLLYATCFNGFCMSAEECVATHAGVTDYCTCGSELVYAPLTACVGATATDEPQPVPFCH